MLFLFICTFSAYAAPVFSQNLSKKQFKKSLNHIQKCVGDTSGIVNWQTDVGMAIAFFSTEEIEIYWKEQISDTIAVSHVRTLDPSGFSAKEYEHHINDFRLDGFIKERECIKKNDLHDRIFLKILKSKNCIGWMELKIEVSS